MCYRCERCGEALRPDQEVVELTRTHSTKIRPVNGIRERIFFHQAHRPASPAGLKEIGRGLLAELEG